MTESATGGKQQCVSPSTTSHHGAMICGGLLVFISGFTAICSAGARGNDSDVSTEATSLFFNPAVPSLSLSQPTLLPFALFTLVFTEPIFTPPPTGHIQIQSCNWVSPSRPECLALTPSSLWRKQSAVPLFLCSWNEACTHLFFPVRA